MLLIIKFRNISAFDVASTSNYYELILFEFRKQNYVVLYHVKTLK